VWNYYEIGHGVLLILITVSVRGLCVFTISMAFIGRVPTMITPFMSFRESITLRWPVTSRTAVGDVIIIQTCEWRFEDDVSTAQVWKRWKLRVARKVTTVTFSILVGTNVGIFRSASPFVISKPSVTVLRVQLFYTSLRHNLLYIWPSFDLVSSGFLKC
jgi:hypothetical protein